MHSYTDERGERQEVTPERWGWMFIMMEGEPFKQFGDDGSFHRFAEARPKEAVAFVMYNLSDETKRVEMPLTETMKPFHFYRNFVLEAGTEQERRVRVYCFGWREKKEGSVFFYVLPDDRILAGPKDMILSFTD